MSTDKKLVRMPEMPCYDCGSVIQGEHSSLCAFSEEDDTLLPDICSKPGSQHLTVEAVASQEARLLEAQFEPGQQVRIMAKGGAALTGDVGRTVTVRSLGRDGQANVDDGATTNPDHKTNGWSVMLWVPLTCLKAL